MPTLQRLDKDVKLRFAQAWSAFMRSIFLTLFTIGATPALADLPAQYTGVWASSRQACRADPRDTGDAGFIVSSKSIEGLEWQCTFKRIRPSRTGYDIDMACAEEGTEFKRRVEWGLNDKSGELIQVEGKKVSSLVRCSAADARLRRSRQY